MISQQRLPLGATINSTDNVPGAGVNTLHGPESAATTGSTAFEKNAHNRFVVYILAFLFTLHISMPAYILSTFLARIAGEELVGLLYAVASLISILAFFTMPRILERFGNYRTILALFVAEIASLVGLATLTGPAALLCIFVLNFIAGAIINFSIDVFLENFSNQAEMGRVRGVFLTSANLAWIVGPLLSGFILGQSADGYFKIFWAAALLLVPVAFIVRSSFHGFRDPSYAPVPIRETVREIITSANHRGVFACAFLLQLFYAWMVIYTPIYLFNHMGFSWEQIGVMIGIALVPFVLTEIPLGWLADTRYGEKEILSIGFIVMALSTMSISFIQSGNFVLWTAILFITRVGASMVEIMTETYFFKKIDGASVNMMSMFRTMRPWASALGPLLAMACLAFMDIQFIFIVLGLAMFYGLRFSLTLEDTR